MEKDQNAANSPANSPENNLKQKIKIITTGGTIEKTYDEDDGLLINRNSIIRDKIQNKLRLPYTDLEVEMVFCKDSLEMNDQDRLTLWECIEKSYRELDGPIVVLHGTDTLDQSVRFGFERNPHPPVPIVFTGAMRPLTYENSDAWQNVIEALMACKIVPPGIYLSFHNRLFKAPNFKKNRQKRTFESVPS